MERMLQNGLIKALSIMAILMSSAVTAWVFVETGAYDLYYGLIQRLLQGL
jgi:hypothetical protein